MEHHKIFWTNSSGEYIVTYFSGSRKDLWQLADRMLKAIATESVDIIGIPITRVGADR